MGIFLANLVGSILAPGPTMRRIARRRSLADAVAALLLLATLLVALSRGSGASAPHAPAMSDGLRAWLIMAAVALAVWLFFAHLLWRLGLLLGGHGRLPAVAATTGMALAVGGMLAALVADDVPLWLSLPMLLWCGWILVTAVRRAHGFSHARAAAATLIVAAIGWACYTAGLPWRFERMLIPELLGALRVNAPAEHLLWPNLAILAALAVLAAGLVGTAIFQRRWLAGGAQVVAGVGLAAVIVGAWFVRYLDRFLTSPMAQPVSVVAASDGGLFVIGVGGGVRIDAEGTVAWRRPDAGDEVLPGPAGTALLLRAAERDILVVAPDGTVARTLPVPDGLPFEMACRLGEVTGDRADRLFLFGGQPMQVFSITLGAESAETAVIADLDDPLAQVIGRPRSLAVGADGLLYLADQAADGRGRVLRFSAERGTAEVIFEAPAEGHERWRLAVGLDGALYLASTREVAGRVTQWQVRRLRPPGEFREVFTRTADQPGCLGTPNPAFTVDAQGTLYAADLDNFCILVLDSDGRLVRTIPGDTWYRSLAVWLIRRTRAG